MCREQHIFRGSPHFLKSDLMKYCCHAVLMLIATKQWHDKAISASFPLQGSGGRMLCVQSVFVVVVGNSLSVNQGFLTNVKHWE